MPRPRLALIVVALATAPAAGQEPPGRELVAQFCAGCHDAADPKGGLDLVSVADADLGQHPAVWEKAVRRLRVGQMPPPGRKQPDPALVAGLEAALDRLAADRPRPGRPDTLRRLTRTEYGHAVRDLLHLDIDAAALLPADEASHGFDNLTVGDLTPTRLDRYLSAAQKVARLAVGGVGRSAGGDTFRVRPDLTQEDRLDGLPVGTRGGTLIRYPFPRAGEYEVQVRLARDRNEHVEGLSEPHELEVLLDRRRVALLTVKPPAAGRGHQEVDAHLRVRLTVAAGPHDLGVTFLKNPLSVAETLRQPYQARFNMHRHPRTAPAVFQVSVLGPFGDSTPGDTPSRRRLFVARPQSPADEEACARQILSAVMRRAYRRPVTTADVDRVLPLYRDARADGDFDAGIEAALSAVLVSREFLFRVERDPPGLAPSTAYPLSDLELASRLSFFLWSSIPDDDLLAAAERGELHTPEQLARQAQRMLADPKARALVTNFAGQWLHLRNLDSVTPDPRLFPNFDDNLRQAMRRETELLFEEVLRGEANVLGLLRSDHTWLNERLARHYGVPHVAGPHFRRVAAADRGGLLRHGSVLTVTSYATRTSPVLRGKWVLETLLGTPPPPPPPDVPALDDNTVSASLPVRERLKEHRANPACASCHNAIDPVGFALEGFDAVGRRRELDEGRPVDSSGGLPDGSRCDGVTGLEDGLLRRPEVFVTALAEKLLTYALGRGVGPADGPAVRGIVRATKAQDYRFAALVEGIVTSPAFRMREAP